MAKGLTQSEHAAKQVSFQISHSCLLVTLNGDLNRETSAALASLILKRSHQIKSELGVILDFSAIDFMDKDSFKEFEKAFYMIRIIGQRVIISGLKPGIISTLIDFDLDISGIRTVLNLEDAYQVFKES